MRFLFGFLLFVVICGQTLSNSAVAQVTSPGAPATAANAAEQFTTEGPTFKSSKDECNPSNLATLQTKRGMYRGIGKNWTVGPTFNYSLVQYNLADKESSLNATAIGVGPSFRYYSDGDLEKYGSAILGRPTQASSTEILASRTSIQDIPPECRQTTYDINETNKIGSWFSINPAIYTFQEKNADDVAVQFALNLGFLDDIFSIGAGYNLSGDNSGEWFILFGPSIALRQ